MVAVGLTTTRAPFIEEAKAHGEVYIRQPYELYSEENQDTWRRLYARIMPRWEKYANEKFLDHDCIARGPKRFFHHNVI